MIGYKGTGDLIFNDQQYSLNSHQSQSSSHVINGKPNNTMNSLETTLSTGLRQSKVHQAMLL